MRHQACSTLKRRSIIGNENKKKSKAVCVELSHLERELKKAERVPCSHENT